MSVEDIALPDIKTASDRPIPIKLQQDTFAISFDGRPVLVPHPGGAVIKFEKQPGRFTYLTEVIGFFPERIDQVETLLEVKREALALVDALPNTDPRKVDARDAIITQIQERALPYLPAFDTQRKQAASELTFSHEYVVMAELLHIPLDSPDLDESGVMQFMIDLRGKRHLTTNNILGYLVQGLGAERLHDTHHVLQFIGGASGLVKDEAYERSLETLLRNIASNERDFDTLFVNPGTDAGISPMIVGIAHEFGIPTATVLALQSILLPGYRPLVDTKKPGWEKGIYAATPCDVALGVPGVLGDERSVLVNEAIATALQSNILQSLQEDLKAQQESADHDTSTPKNARIATARLALEKARSFTGENHVDRTAVIINGGTRSIGEIIGFIDGFNKVPDSQIIISRNSGRLATYLATILENGIVDQRGLLIYAQAHGMLGHTIEESKMIQHEIAQLSYAGLFDLARELTDLSVNQWGRVHIMNMEDGEMKQYHALPTLIYKWGQRPQTP